MNLRNAIFTVAMTAFAGSAFAAPPSTAPAAPASATAPAKQAPTKHKHATKAEKKAEKNTEAKRS